MATWGTGKPKPGLVLKAICGDGTCHACLNPVGSPLHHELCEVSSGEHATRQRRHGTDSGYQGHVKNGTPPCQPCRDARAATSRQQRARAREAA